MREASRPERRAVANVLSVSGPHPAHSRMVCSHLIKKKGGVAIPTSLFLFAFGVALFFCSPGEVIACTCIRPQSPCEAFRERAAVFRGRVLDLSTVEVSDPSIGSYPLRSVLFAVEMSWKGIDQKVIRVITGLDGAACGYQFQPGGRYLVYADQDPSGNRLSTSICTRTRPLAKAGEDVLLLDRLAKPGAIASIYGTIHRAGGGILSKTEILIDGKGGQFRSSPDNKGRYRVSGLPVGRYRVRLKLPPDLDPDPLEGIVELNDPRDCVEVSFRADPAGRIEGALRDGTGKPAVGIIVSAIPTERLKESLTTPWMYARTTGTDERGRFILKHLMLGSYLIRATWGEKGAESITEAGFEFFYPRASQVAQAEEIVVRQGGRKVLSDFILPTGFSERWAEGYLLLPDGRPAVGAHVSLMTHLSHSGASAMAREVTTDRNGRFSFPAYKELEYLIIAKHEAEFESRVTQFYTQSSLPADVPSPSTPIRLKFEPPRSGSK